MTIEESESATPAAPKKAWTEPELETLPAGESELVPPGPGPDGSTGVS